MNSNYHASRASENQINGFLPDFCWLSMILLWAINEAREGNAVDMESQLSICEMSTSCHFCVYFNHFSRHTHTHIHTIIECNDCGVDGKVDKIRETVVKYITRIERIKLQCVRQL